MLLCKLCSGLFAVAGVDDEAPFCLTCFEPQKGHFLRLEVFGPWKLYSVRVTKIFSMNFVHYPKKCGCTFLMRHCPMANLPAKRISLCSPSGFPQAMLRVRQFLRHWRAELAGGVR